MRIPSIEEIAYKLEQKHKNAGKEGTGKAVKTTDEEIAELHTFLNLQSVKEGTKQVQKEMAAAQARILELLKTKD